MQIISHSKLSTMKWIARKKTGYTPTQIEVVWDQEFLIVGKTDIEKAVYLLREIDAFLSFNISPPPEQMTEMRKTIQEFTSHFPECWKCGDSGYVGTGFDGDQKCNCV